MRDEREKKPTLNTTIALDIRFERVSNQFTFVYN